MCRFANGSLATFESTRYARGHKARLHLRDQRRERLAGLGSARSAPAASITTTGRRKQAARLEVGPCHRQQPRASLHGQMVGARPANRLRAFVRSPGRRLPEGRRHRANPPCPISATRIARNLCLTPSWIRRRMGRGRKWPPPKGDAVNRDAKSSERDAGGHGPRCPGLF